jgi:predicted ABC-type ATPase
MKSSEQGRFNYSCFVIINYLYPMPNLYIIAGCNGAGKTTASYTILPEMLNCREFVNADSIASGISPFNPQHAAFAAGRIMLQRIHQLIYEKEDFAFETTLSTRSYVSLIKFARKAGYEISLLFLWLESPELAKQRVAERVSKGGHDIPSDVIERRFYRGLHNLFNLYIPLCDSWIVVDTMNLLIRVIAEGKKENEQLITNAEIWETILKQSGHGK